MHQYLGISREPGLSDYLTAPLHGRLDALFLVDRGMQAEGGGVFYFDLPAQRESTEASWVREAEAWLREAGVEIGMENTSALLRTMRRTQGYYGWISTDSAVDVEMPRPEWLLGGLAVTFHKRTGESVRAAQTGEEETGPFLGGREMIAGGATGFGGFVGEPTTQGLFRPQLLFPAYVSGFNLAESYFLSLRYLGWRQVIVGDPLASPYHAKTRSLRESLSVGAGCGVDTSTELPECFSGRRRTFLVNQHSSGEEAVNALLKGEVLVARGELQAARTALEASLQRNSLLPEAHDLLAQVLEAEGDYESAFEHYRMSLKLGKATASLQLKLASLAWYELRNPERARPHALWVYGKMGSHRPTSAGLWAEVNLELGNIREAEGIYHRLIEQSDPPPAFALSALGQISYQKGEFDQAREFLGRALEAEAPVPGLSRLSPEGLPKPIFDVEATQKLLDQIEEKASHEVDKAPEFDSPSRAEKTSKKTRPAQVLKRTSVKYPARATAEGIEGPVVLSLLLDEQGQFLKASKVHGHHWLAEAAMKSVRNWTFQPRLVNGKPVPSRLTVSLNFLLKR